MALYGQYGRKAQNGRGTVEIVIQALQKKKSKVVTKTRNITRNTKDMDGKQLTKKKVNVYIHQKK